MRFFFGSDLEGLHDSRVNLMLDTSKLSFCVFPDDCDVNIGVFSFDARMREAQINIRE